MKQYTSDMNDKAFAIGVSLFVHLVAIGLLVMNFERTPEPRHAAATPEVEPIQAAVAERAAVEAELEKLRAEERRQREAEEARKRRIEQEARAAREAREREQKRLAELKRQQEAEKKKQTEAERQRKAAAEVEKKRLAEEKRRQEEAARQKAEAEKRQLEAKRKAEEEARRKAEAEAETKRKAEQALKEQMAAEEARLAAERQRELQSLLARYIGDITAKVQRRWIRPAGVPDLTCKVLVRQTPVGDVVDVQILQSSGNPLFDRSVESAVRMASPLPSPPHPDLFEREIEFTFKPR